MRIGEHPRAHGLEKRGPWRNLHSKVHSQSQKPLESTLWLSTFPQMNCFQGSGMYVHAHLCAFGEGCGQARG